MKRIAKLFFNIVINTINNCSLYFHRLFNNNKTFTLISRGCIGGIVYKQYGMKFLSPTINLFFSLEDFNYFCNNLHEYIDGHMEEMAENKYRCPVGILYPTTNNLPSINIYFNHYHSFEEANQKMGREKKTN